MDDRQATFVPTVRSESDVRTQSFALALVVFNPLPDPGFPHGGPLGRRTRPAAAHAAPEVPW